jgi:peptidoglycan/xylan/chitin deacetylase (PgdA/CDA1 family)
MEAVLGHPVGGGRKHYLNLEVPTTWRRHASIGLQYDATLGVRAGYGFQFGYDVLRPFDDSFVVFPLTLMETRLPDVASHPDRAWRECDRLLEEARRHGAVMTVLWHPRYFNEDEFPGYRRLYRRLVEREQGMGAWVGPPAERYAQLTDDDTAERIPATGR